MKDLAPSEVRKMICDEHRDIEARMLRLEELIDHGDRGSVVGATREFSRLFLAHVENEERILLPALFDIDAWGEVRVERMKKEHLFQRRRISELLSLVEQGRAEQYGPALREFFRELRADIELEESETVSAEVMKDDPITVGGDWE